MSDPASHFPFDQLYDFVNGRLGADERARVYEHTAGCLRCSADIAWLDKTVSVLRPDGVGYDPALARGRVHELFRARRVTRSAFSRRINPTLRSTSVHPTPSAHTAERQLLFDAGDFDIELRIAAVGAQWTVAGQLFGPEITGVAQLRGPASGADVALSPLGEFVLPPLPSGTYAFVLRLEDLELEIPELQLG